MSGLVSLSAVVHERALVEGHVGPRTVVHPFAYVAACVVVGADCVIGPGAVLGADGFGYADADGRWERKPQSHGVVIGDDVHVGANACVDRGSWRHTRVGRGTRIDNLVHVAHNAEVGEDCLVVAHAMLAGSSVLGDHAYVAPHGCVREHVTVGEDAFVALGAVVTSDVGDGEWVRGVPAKTFEPGPAALAAKPPRHVVASRR